MGDIMGAENGAPGIGAWLKSFSPVLLYIVCIWLCQYLSSVGPIEDAEGLLDSLPSYLGKFFGVPPRSDPFVAMLTGVNLVTVFYGLWYYTDNRQRLGYWPAIFAVALATFLLFLASAGPSIAEKLAQGYQDENAKDGQKEYFVALFNVYKEFAVAFCVTMFFALVDYYKYCKLNDTVERARLYFQSLYISVPTLIALIIAFLFYSTASAIGNPNYERSVAYLAGVSGLIVVLSNVIFALFCVPGYAGQLIIRLKE